MLRGNYSHAVDDKGRVAIPARFREALSGRLQDERLVVTNFKRRERPCLDVYPVASWERFLEKVTDKKRFSPRVGAFEDWYVGNAADVEPDTQGRILIPPPLRSFAQIERDVMIVGLTDKFRIWNRELYHQVNAENEREVFGDATLLDDLGL